jgi:hypothetical protein
MQRSLADRLSRAVVGCYPPRWKRRCAAELLDVLDQHHGGPRTVLNLVGGALSTHLDPDYRMRIRLMPPLEPGRQPSPSSLPRPSASRAGDPPHGPQGHQGKQMGTVQQR